MSSIASTKGDHHLVLQGVVEESKEIKLAGRSIECIKGTNIRAFFLSIRQYFACTAAFQGKIEVYKWTKISDASSQKSYRVKTEKLASQIGKSENLQVNSPAQRKELHKLWKLNVDISNYLKEKYNLTMYEYSNSNFPEFGFDIKDGNIIFYIIEMKNISLKLQYKINQLEDPSKDIKDVIDMFLKVRCLIYKIPELKKRMLFII